MRVVLNTRRLERLEGSNKKRGSHVTSGRAVMTGHDVPIYLVRHVEFLLHILLFFFTLAQTLFRRGTSRHVISRHITCLYLICPKLSLARPKVIVTLGSSPRGKPRHIILYLGLLLT